MVWVTIRRNLAAAGEITAAPLSFLLYRLTRFCVRCLVRLDGRRRAGRAAQWQALNGPAVRMPLNLLALMTSAPRWNTHALIALAGPVQVQRTIRIHEATASASAASWTLVVHAEPARSIVASIGPREGTRDDQWQSVDLPPGSYRLALRYYHWSELAVLPAVEVDGTTVVAAAAIPGDTNDFYRDLHQAGGLLYLCLHSYVCTILRYQRWLPRSFVEREYLPAGNPQTVFRYGFLPAGASLDIELDDTLLQTHDAYFTAYNRASFPILWYPLTQRRHQTPASPVSGSYLIRLHAKAPAARREAELTGVRVSTARS